MPSHTDITVAQLSRLIGLATAPLIIDVRIASDFDLDPRFIPASLRRDYREVASWGPALQKQPLVIVCQQGKKLSQGVAAYLRQMGHVAETLEGGFEAWSAASLPLVPAAALPLRTMQEQSLWVTRARPKIDRIACPWLIKRFIDPTAVFLFVSASEVLSVAERFSATAFDVEGCFFSHRGELCSFDVMLQAFGLETAPLLHLARIVRGADTNRLELAPEAAGLLAVSLGLSRNFWDDLKQLAAALPVYDGFYRWCRDATDETHDWPLTKGKA